MPLSSLRVVQRGPPLPKGTPEFEELRQSVAKELAASVPDSLVLPESTVTSPPKNVTSVPRECGLLSASEVEITERYDATSLAEAIATNKLTAVAVATAFAKRAIIAHQLTSCLTEWFMDEAIARAQSLDDHLAKTGKTVGPLHGVPISVKLHVPVAGHWSDVGYVDTRVKDEADCQMTAILRDAGAVFYCKTTQPQAIMHLETVSPLHGRVLNPHNIELSAGGSSGGEAALIALRGSVLGIGTDIGGSVRGPASFCGIYGYKATSYSLPGSGFLPLGYDAQLNIVTSTGPMGASLRDLDLFTTTLKAAKPHIQDPSLVPLPWTGLAGEPLAKDRPLKVGILRHDGNITPQPPVVAALDWAQTQLRKAGFDVKPFAPYRTAEAISNIRCAYWPDGGKVARHHMAAGGEPVLTLTDWVLKEATDGGELAVAGVQKQRFDRDAFRMDFARHWNEQDVDILLSPGFIGPACAHDTALYWNYTAFWNYVDYPGAVFPTPIVVGEGGAAKAAYDASTPPLSETCKHVRKMWEEGDFEGAPINLQAVARRYGDDELFRGLAAIKDALNLQ